MRPFPIVSSLAIAATLSLTMCGKSGDKGKEGAQAPGGPGGPSPTSTPPPGPGEMVTITGALNLSPSLLALLDPLRRLALEAEPLFDELWSIPLMGNTPNLAGNIVKVPRTDGKFSIKADGSREALLVLVNSRATGDSEPEKRLNQIVRFVGFDAGTKELIRLPLSSAKDDSVDMGTVTVGTSAAKSDKTIAQAAADDFSVTESSLREFARTNDALKIVKNQHANSRDGVTYSFDPVFMFHGNTNLALSDYSPAAQTVYTGYIVFINSNDSALPLTDVCSKTRSIALVPPTTIHKISSPSTTYSVLDNSLINEDQSTATSGASCGGGEFYAHGGTGGDPLSLNWGGGDGFAGATQTGIWKFQVDGAVKAAFDLAAITPVDATGKPTIYVPMLKIERNEQERLTKVSFKIKVYDVASDSFVDPADLTTALSLMANTTISLTDYSKRDTCTFPNISQSHDIAPDASGVFSLAIPETQAWTMDGAGDSCAAGSITFNYRLSGLSYMFDFRDRN